MWLGVAMGGLVAFGALMPRLGRSIGWGWAATLPLLAMGVAWIFSVIDLFFVREGERVPLWQTLAFVFAGLVAPIAASTFLRAFAIESLVVPTRSMEPTVLADDRLFADKRDRKARYGDVIVFASPENQQLLVKRVVARPGDALEMKRGKPWINGWPIPSCSLGIVTLGEANGELVVEFLGDASYLVFYDALAPVAMHAGPLYASDDSVLVLGDDRNDSADSRVWKGGRDGNVHASALRGRALFVWMRTSPIDGARFGVGLDRLVLPTSLAVARSKLDECLANRPDAFPPKPLLARFRSP